MAPPRAPPPLTVLFLALLLVERAAPREEAYARGAATVWTGGGPGPPDGDSRLSLPCESRHFLQQQQSFAKYEDDPLDKQQQRNQRKNNNNNKKLEKKTLLSAVGDDAYKWFHNGTEIDDEDQRRTVLADGTLLFKTFETAQDEGDYRCLADNAYGATLSKSTLVRTASMDERFTESPRDDVVYEGDAFRLACSVRSAPEANVAWEKDSTKLPDNTRFYHFDGGSVLVIDARKEDSGLYRCRVTNDVLNRTIYSRVANVSVVSPNVKSYDLSFVNVDDFDGLKNVSRLHGKEVVLGCAVKGRPRPKVIWSFQPDEDVEAESKKEFNSMEMLKLPHLTENNGGTYSCVATNGNQTIEQAYHLSVLRAPFLRQKPIPEDTPTAKTVRFNCSADGNPTPKITWYKDGKPLSITGRLKVKASKKGLPGLIISDTISSDTGVYQCIASSFLGEAEGSALLVVRSSEGVTPPMSVECQPLNLRTIRITWKTPKRLSVVAFTIHYMIADGGEEHSLVVNEAFSTDYTMEKLKPYEKYEFYLKLYVNKGASDQSMHVTCNGQGVPIIVYSFNNGSVLLSWREAARAFVSIAEWKVQFRQIEGTVKEILLPANSSMHLIDLSAPVENYDFRVLASTSYDWLQQNLSSIPWSSGNKTIPFSSQIFQLEDRRGVAFMLNEFGSNRTDLDKLNETYLNALEAYSKNYTHAPKPTDVSAYATGPHTINVTWKCDVAEENPNFYSFVICYFRYYDENDEEEENKDEKCVQSSKNWIEITNLKQGTLYALKVQSKTQNQVTGGFFSDILMCRTKHEVTNSVKNVNWKRLENNVLKITWTPSSEQSKAAFDRILNTHVSDSKQTTVVYTVFYGNNRTAALTEWKSKNVTNSTQTNLSDVDLNTPCYVMVSIMGEERGPLIEIPVGGRISQDSDSNLYISNFSSMGIIIMVVVLVLIIGLVFFIWRMLKRKKNNQNTQGPACTNRLVKFYNYHEFDVISTSQTADSKGGAVYMNGISSSAKKQGVGEPLLNGHVHITENPRFSSKKFMPNGSSWTCKKNHPVDSALDMSRYDEIPNTTTETIVENETTNLDDSAITAIAESVEELDSVPNISNCSAVEIDNEVVVVQVDRNSNSEMSNINRMKESKENDAHTVDGKLDKDRVTYRSILMGLTNNVPDQSHHGVLRLTPALGRNG